MFIELHCLGEPRLINVDAIAQVMPSKLESAITLNGQIIPTIYDECYDNVKKVIEDAFDH